ncbi:hypothetical protein JKF63_05900 [Porcisia hertigi]|uniref:ZZ-type domain-containing protein n=1 Tax=Porcisia hertigi TaxID=2761500 RepID=A0A836HV70_9TRYP|nr:hypothetical protein JKF63_05900 [Porcisia hertigi]
MSHSKNEPREVRHLTTAQEWGALVEYEQGEIVFQLLKRISETCLRHGHLRVMEREDFMCYGIHTNGTSSARRLLLYGRVRYSHREALLALVRQLRLHSVRDLETLVTAALQTGELVPHLLLEPLTPSLHTNAYVLWYRVYCAMKCGIFHVLVQQQRKLKHRLHALVSETSETHLKKGGAEHTKSGAAGNAATSLPQVNSSMHADTLRFYTQEFSHLFSEDTDVSTKNGDANNLEGPSALGDFMAATKETRVSLACIAATTPCVFVAWSYRCPGCVEWLERNLFNDTLLQEMLDKTGLSRRFAVLLSRDPWLSFASEHGEVLPRPSAKEGFRINLLKPLSKRAQIVLLNVDEDAGEARATLERLKAKLCGWQSPEVDMLSLWCGSEGLQSELATLFHIESLPFIVDARPGGYDGSAKTMNRWRKRTLSSRRPVIVRSSRDTVVVAKDIYGISDTPKVHRRGDGAGVPALVSGRGKSWHDIAVPERAHIADRLSKHIVQHRLPLCFTALVEREYVIRNPYTNVPWKALECIVSSHVKIDGEYVSGHDLMPVATELRSLHQLDGFEFNAAIIEPSAPLVSSLEKATTLSRVQGRMHVVTCANCQLIIDVNNVAHARCLHCSPSDRSSVLCEACAFTALCHPPHHILLRIPAGVWAPSLPLLWGPSNVTPFPLFLGKFVSNRTGCHHGVYCDKCSMMIYGTRWKCALCYQYDLCDACNHSSGKPWTLTKSKLNTSARADALPPTMSSESSQLRTTLNVTPLCHHDATHPMLFIPYTQGSNPNGMLKPQCSANLGEWLRTLSDAAA